MKDNKLCIIEIGSNNTKTHIYEDNKILVDTNITIEFKKNYKENNNKILDEDMEKLFQVIEEAKKYTNNINLYGTSIFRKLTTEELDSINKELRDKYKVFINVVYQEEEALYTAKGAYNDINYNGNICVFIGGGGSIELIFVNNKKIIDKKYYDFGVVDITNEFPSLKADVSSVSFEEVESFVNNKIGNICTKADVLILAGGDHLYWYNNAKYKLEKNTLYQNEKQDSMLTIQKSDEYDHDMITSSLDKIRNNSDNPKWFDGSRAMKVVTNVISHKIDAKYIVPTRINMEDGIKALFN